MSSPLDISSSVGGSDAIQQAGTVSLVSGRPAGSNPLTPVLVFVILAGGLAGVWILGKIK